MEEFVSHCVFSTDSPESERLPAHRSEDGVTFRFHATAGLYQFSVAADARDFDWDGLYIELHAFNNGGRRTGPWDFHPLQENRPLVPSYWVYLDGRRLGLWYFQRVSLEDLTARCFRGRMAFWLREPGEHELKLVPYQSVKLRWISARLELDPEDTLLPEAVVQQNTTTPFIARWADADFWAEKRAELRTSHARYREPLTRAWDFVLSEESPGPNEWMVLITAHHLEQRPGALETLLRLVDELISKPAWNNPREDGYGHNGDMGAAFALRALTWAYYALGDELGEARRAKMREKLVLQGERFIETMLLNRDYWGGSLLQDHGWRSAHTFCFVALSLLNIVPEAGEWLRYILPRAQRALAAMPRDGVVPESSHNSLVLYLDDVCDLRDALLAWNGQDIYDLYPFRAVVDFVTSSESSQVMGNRVGGNGFFNQIAAQYRDGHAAWAENQLLSNPPATWGSMSRRQGYFADLVRGFLTYNPTIQAVTPKTQSLNFFPDSGLVDFYDTASGISFTTQCGPWIGHHAYRHADGPCDRMGLAPGAGHFMLRRGGTELLTNPEAGYALQSAIRSCLLIGGKGQHGDIGYPMSIPSKIHRGEEIERVQWDEDTKTGQVRLNLRPAYDEETGLVFYTRDFLFQPGQITVRDHVVLKEPQTLSWLFQGKDINLESTTLTASFGGADGATLQALAGDLPLQSSIRQTPVVWSYASPNDYKPFHHVRFDTTVPVDNAAADFVIRW